MPWFRRRHPTDPMWPLASQHLPGTYQLNFSKILEMHAKFGKLCMCKWASRRQALSNCVNETVQVMRDWTPDRVASNECASVVGIVSHTTPTPPNPTPPWSKKHHGYRVVRISDIRKLNLAFLQIKGFVSLLRRPFFIVVITDWRMWWHAFPMIAVSIVESFWTLYRPQLGNMQPRCKHAAFPEAAGQCIK